MNRDEIRRALSDDPASSAREAGLRYLNDDTPGYVRRPWGKGFTYRDPKGRTVRDRRLRERFAELAIPPAWTEVWISPDRRGHLQATGRDAAGRKQYLYHPRFREARDRAKFERMVAFGHVLPRIRRRVAADLRQEGLPRTKVLAAVVRLLETTLARVGNDEYARENDSYGLTTIRKKHVDVREGAEEVLLRFEGKGGRVWETVVDDPRVLEVVVECSETPGYELFKYFDADGVKRDVKSEDVNDYLRDVAGAPVRAKDFRTWAGTVLAAGKLREVDAELPDAPVDRKLVRAVERVADQLGNTPAVCRSAYIHPHVLDGLEGGLLDRLSEGRRRSRRRGLGASEAAVLGYLEDRLGEATSG